MKRMLATLMVLSLSLALAENMLLNRGGWRIHGGVLVEYAMDSDD